MSDGMNKVILLGRVGTEPELRHTTSGTPVLSFRLATTEGWMDKNREPQERTERHNVVVWGNRAEGLHRHLAKGSNIVVEGGLRTSSYEKDGQKRFKTEVHARDLFFTGRRTQSGDGDPEGTSVPTGLEGFTPPLKTPVDELPY